MKKTILSFVVAIVATTTTYAQNTLVATLSHGDDIQMFYGTYALRDAHNAAVSGDIINLSGGAFQAITITKGVTLRGTGIDDIAPTYINGDLTINVASDDDNRLSMEGIRCTGKTTLKGTLNSPYFLKSMFYAIINPNSSDKIKNALFANCKIEGYYDLRGSSSVQFINSYVYGFNNSFTSSTSSASFINCVIYPYYNGFNTSDIRCSQLLNCIICTTNGGNALPNSTMATNCVAIGYNDLFSGNAANTKNSTASFAEVFKNFTGTYSDEQTFELTDEAKTKYLGNDGTEVGMYGGVLPYSSTPSYPQITKMNVANKTTADGKLSVEIEVSAAE